MYSAAVKCKRSRPDLYFVAGTVLAPAGGHFQIRCFSMKLRIFGLELRNFEPKLRNLLLKLWLPRRRVANKYPLGGIFLQVPA